MDVFAQIANFLSRLAWFLRENLRYGYWMIPCLVSGFFLYRLSAAFLPLKPRRRWRAVLYLFLSGVTGMVIWVGDNNLLFTMPVFFAVFLLCSQGDLAGRAAVTAVFFCLVMSVSAMLDTYYAEIMHRFGSDNVFHYTNRLLRPVIWGLLWLAVRKRLPERPPRLTPRLWKLILILAAMPFSSLTAVVLLTYQKYDSPALNTLIMSLGLAVLPFVLLTSLALLYAVLVLADQARLERAVRLNDLRESYYRAFQREERQVRTLRHDLRNHLTVLRGLLELEEPAKALDYVDQLFPALQGGRRLCENEAANAILSAKAEAMGRAGLTAELSVSLPGDLPIADTDLCALLGNALDNAMEAAERTKDKAVSLRCRAERGMFMLRVENSFAGEVPPDLSTTKADKAAHGFGVPGMREIAERLGGSLETRASGGRFELVVCVPL